MEGTVSENTNLCCLLQAKFVSLSSGSPLQLMVPFRAENLLRLEKHMFLCFHVICNL